MKRHPPSSAREAREGEKRQQTALAFVFSPKSLSQKLLIYTAESSREDQEAAMTREGN